MYRKRVKLVMSSDCKVCHRRPADCQCAIISGCSYSSQYERLMKSISDDWSKCTIDNRFNNPKVYVSTPGWGRFKEAVENHIKELEEKGQ